MVNLSEMGRITRRAEKIKDAIRRAEERATRTTIRPTGMPHTRQRTSLVEEGAVTAADLKDVYAETIRKVQQMRGELSDMIDTLPNEDNRAIMRMRYLLGYKPEFIADAVFMSVRNVFHRMKTSKQQLMEKFPGRLIIEEEDQPAERKRS